MKPSPKAGFSSSYFTSTTVTYTYHNDHTQQHANSNSTQLPSQSNAAVTIQSAYRAHRIRALYRKIAAVDAEADQLQRLIQRQDTVDAVRTNHLEKLRMNEALMALLLKLDSVPGIDPTVRDARRKVTRRIVGLQEILDSVSEAQIDESSWWPMKNWDEVIADMEESICRERGGDEMERFCAQNLGFRCLQSYISHLVMQLGLEVPSHKHRAMQCRIGVQDGQAFFIWFTMQSLHPVPSVGGQLMIGEATITIISNNACAWTATLCFFISM
ncbi:BAG family molecular chaperone regulator 5, mitochondrial, partial [Mucuna pruriens]